MFVVIFLMFLCDSIIYDLVEHGKIKTATSTLAHAFDDIGRATTLWFYELLLALIFYPGLLLYSTGATILKNGTGLSRAMKALTTTALIALHTALVARPVWDLCRNHLAVGSALIVLCEMFRFFMKIHAVTIACASRWRNGPTLPSFKYYLYYLFAPTFVYRDQYPRIKTTNWGVVLFNLSEVAAIILYHCFFWDRVILPHWADYGKDSKVSGVAHEVILTAAFGFFYPVLMVQFSVFGLLLVPATESSGRRYPNLLNLLIWLGFFVGNGMRHCIAIGSPLGFMVLEQKLRNYNYPLL